MTTISIGLQNRMTMQTGSVNANSAADGTNDFGKIFDLQKNDSSNQTDRISETSRLKKDTLPETKSTETKSAESNINDNDSDKKIEDTNAVDCKEGCEKKVDSSSETLQSKDSSENEIDEETVEILAGALNLLQQMITDQLGISEEELDSFLQENGLELQDLLNPENVTKLVLHSEGVEDASELLTNESLFEANKFLQNEISEVKNEMARNGVDVEEVSGETFDAALKEVKQPGNIPELSGDSQGSELSNDSSKNGEQSNVKTKHSVKDVQPQFMNYNINGQVIGQDAQGVLQTTSYSTTSYVDQTNNVMNQVMNQIRLQVTADNTEVHLQLQPETLGTLQIQITAKEGLMTAHFSAENEDVKNILETQMDLLKQSFAEQNIKVDAIEVSVGTQLFDNELMNQSENGQEDKPAEKRRRNISLEELNSDMQVDLDSEEQILAEMMKANGNTVDFQA